MGFIDTFPNSEGLPIFFNVVHAVGKNAPNARDDVKLIQYLLMSFYDKFPDKPSGEMSVTGYCGPVTMRWILDFQMRVNKKFPNSILADNRVDRVRDHSTVTSISKTQYTLGVLNNSVKDRNIDAFVALPSIVPLENPLNVPPPSRDVVNSEKPVPQYGGV
jgi:hypothetical protein